MNQLSSLNINQFFRRYERYFPAIIIALLLLGLVAFIFKYNDRINRKDAYLNNIAILESDIALFEAQKLQLESELEFAKSDAAVEAWAGGTARMAKPGEKLIIPIPSGEPVVAQPITEPVAEPVEPNYESWLDLFLNR